ncbi:dihydrofolate reductase family protein [Haliangium ochraceum]|uniref:Bifunctional deaminase-reductase domain protein n=1 Tax=Haliangium ochraceum (strain DSM 14365 / JCM 11303 / SMP-2) TaxID=502025 RepID=D0LSH2_HALO1|nr:dihydrofolate reductase family protein [Haliangium ochraceum]ACY15671.1 bifunctional deaminase-reductase domain protein [Haliangium ochraceum DSM 14365]
METRRRCFIACSLDGFIAGPGDDLDWLPAPDVSPSGEELDEGGFRGFLAQIGALLMGRRTYEVVAAMDGDWPYGNRPVLVATHRPLDNAPRTVHAVSGDIASMVETACQAAGERDVYIDGGELLRQALDAELLDELVVTVVPVVLGQGTPLFAGAERRRELVLVSSRVFGAGLVQLRYRPVSAG